MIAKVGRGGRSIAEAGGPSARVWHGPSSLPFFFPSPSPSPTRCNPTRQTPEAAHCADRSPCGRRAQKKFLDLGGSAENQGDLRSVVLHKMTLQAQKSTFPIALGVRLTGVDDKAFAKTGESYSMIAMPNADSHTSRVLQEDNTELAYEFARKFVRNATQTHPRNSRLTTPSVRSPAGLHRGELGHQGHPRGASLPLPLTRSQLLLTRACLLARRSRRAASALWPRITRSCPRLAPFNQTHIYTPTPRSAHVPPLLCADLRERREAPVRLTSNRSPHRPTWLGMTFAPPCLRRMGEISMCAASCALP